MSVSLAYSARFNRGLRFIGSFFAVLGVFNLIVGAFALIVVLVTGADAEGAAIVAMFFGSGVAWSLIGFGMRRLSL